MREILFLGFLVTSLVQAQVIELEQGSCWIEPIDQRLKISSFPEGYSKSLSRLEINDFITAQKKHLGIESDSSRIHFFCSSMQTRVLIGLSDSPICIHGRLINGKLQLIDTYSKDLTESSSSPCIGHAKQMLLIFGEQNMQMESYLKNKYEEIENFKYKVGFYEVNLKLDYRFNETYVVDRMKNDPKLEGYNIEFNSIILPVGSYYFWDEE